MFLRFFLPGVLAVLLSSCGNFRHEYPDYTLYRTFLNPRTKAFCDVSLGELAAQKEWTRTVRTPAKVDPFDFGISHGFSERHQQNSPQSTGSLEVKIYSHPGRRFLGLVRFDSDLRQVSKKIKSGELADSFVLEVTASGYWEPGECIGFSYLFPYTGTRRPW